MRDSATGNTQPGTTPRANPRAGYDSWGCRGTAPRGRPRHQGVNPGEERDKKKAPAGDDPTGKSWGEVRLLAPYAVICVVGLLLSVGALDVLAVGEEEATTLGLKPRTIRRLVLLVASLGAAAAVAVSGLIGFVGLVVPQAVRMLAGSSHRRVVPLLLLFGASFLALADVVARTVRAPAELPIGVITAFIGAPFFLLILRRQTLS